MDAETFDRGIEETLHVCFHAIHYAVLRNGESIPLKIIAADEVWSHHFDLATKSKNMEWQHSSSPRQQKTL